MKRDYDQEEAGFESGGGGKAEVKVSNGKKKSEMAPAQPPIKPVEENNMGSEDMEISDSP